MNERLFTGRFAGIQLTYAFRHPETASFFEGWLEPVSEAQESAVLSDSEIIRVPLSDCEHWIREYGMKDDGNTEFGMSVYRSSDRLLQKDRCLIHGAAMLWKGKAWLFAADSGTGKSTQISLWKDLFPEEVRIMNGDKPILRLEEGGSFTVHPSPWKGKEEWGDDALSAPLGGIILLQRAKEDRIEILRPVQCAARLLSLFFCTFEDRETTRLLCRMEEKLLASAPVWRLHNLGGEESVLLTRETLLAWLREQQ